MICINRCVCTKQSFEQLLRQAKQNQWSLPQLVASTQAGSQCELCLPYLRQMLQTGQVVFDQLLPVSDLDARDALS